MDDHRGDKAFVPTRGACQKHFHIPYQMRLQHTQRNNRQFKVLLAFNKCNFLHNLKKWKKTNLDECCLFLEQ